MSNKMQKAAAQLLEQAIAQMAQATEMMKVATRFGVEPVDGTILVFDKIFSNETEALDSRGLDFDPLKLVPNNASGLLNLLGLGGLDGLSGRVVDGGTSVVYDDINQFAATQRTSYRHVAIRVGRTWYTTSAQITKVSWERLSEFIGDARCWKVTGLEEIPVEPVEVIEEARQVTEAAPTAAPNAADAIKSNRPAIMAALRKARANGKNPTPAQIMAVITSTVNGSDAE